MSRGYRPIDAALLAESLADYLTRDRPEHPLRVAIDGPPCADPGAWADALVEPLRTRSRPALRVEAETFWRDASVRLEYGRTDVHAYAHDWLDAAALRREVLDPLVPCGRGEFLPSLRDPVSNRATRAARKPAPEGAILLVSGSLLLGRDLPFDRTVHLAVSAAGRQRRTPEEQAWTLPAYADYDAEVDPLRRADVVIRLDDPRHPAVGWPD